MKKTNQSEKNILRLLNKMRQDITRMQTLADAENRELAQAKLRAGKSKDLAEKTGYSDQHLRAVKCGENKMTDRLARRIMHAK